MSVSVDVFVSAQKPIEDFVRELESLLGIKFQFIRISEDVSFYEYRNSHVAVTVLKHDLENDRELRFEDYPYQISVRALNIDTEEERKQRREDFARLVFEKLKRTNKYNLMLVENLQLKLDEFRPRHP